MNLLILCAATVLSVAAGSSETALQSFDNANQKFSSRFLTEVLKKNPKKNVIMSAYSVLPVLAQLSLAAKGKTKSEIQNVISLTDDDLLKEAITAASDKIGIIQLATIKLANKIYLAKGVEVNPVFDDVSKKVFGSGVENADFQNAAKAANYINTWVENQTNNKIKNLVKEKDVKGAKLVLVNSIYFKGAWMNTFVSKNTKKLPFHVSNTKVVQVPMMRARFDTRYGESKALGAKLVELDYAGKDVSFVVVLPNKIDGLDDVLKKLRESDHLTQALEGMYTAKVNLSLPKFKVETTTNLKDVLTNMGIKTVFGSDADLSKLLQGDSKVSLSAALQKAYIEVNENGTEASAANAFIAVGAPLFEPPNIDLTIDRPFYFEIQAKKENIYSGVILEPEL